MDFAFFESYRFAYAHPGTQLKDHVYERSRRLFAEGDARRDALGSRAEVVKRQQEIRAFVAQSLGGLPSSETPLNARVQGVVEGDGFTIEKVTFESRPRHYVTANLYLPRHRPQRCPAVLFLCGHADDAKGYPVYQSVCQTLAMAGLIVLAQDPVGQGERVSYYDPEKKIPTIRCGTRDHDYAGAQCRFLGDSLARYFLHDAMRGIDYLLTRPEVDPERIGVTGNSGGGTQTSLLMLADPRIAAAAPGTFVMNRESYQRTGQAQDAEQIWPGFTEAGYDHEDILLAMAPKPVCVLAVAYDFFPIEGTRRTVERSRRIWDLFGAPDNLKLVEDRSVHAYTLPLARAAARFFSKHLNGCEISEAEAANLVPKPFAPSALWCTGTGQVKGDYADAEFVFDANLARVAQAEAERQRLPAAQRRERALGWLREAVFAHRIPGDLNPRLITQSESSGSLETDVAFWYTQPYLANLGMLLRPGKRAKRLPVTLALWDGGSHAIRRHFPWLRRECGEGRAVLVLNLCGMGPLRPLPLNHGDDHDFYGAFHKLSDDLTWIGDSLAALRTYEFLRALDVLPLWPDLDLDDIRAYAHGRIGIHARLAAALDPRIAGCEWKDGFEFADFVKERFYDSSDIKSLILPGALRYFDVGEL